MSMNLTKRLLGLLGVTLSSILPLHGEPKGADDAFGKMLSEYVQRGETDFFMETQDISALAGWNASDLVRGAVDVLSESEVGLEFRAARWILCCFPELALQEFRKRLPEGVEGDLNVRRALTAWVTVSCMSYAEGFRFCMDRLLVDTGLDHDGRIGEETGMPKRLCDVSFPIAARKIAGVESVFGREESVTSQIVTSGYAERDEMLGRFRGWWKENAPFVDWYPDRGMFMVNRHAKAAKMPVEKWKGMSEVEQEGAVKKLKDAGKYVLEDEVPEITSLTRGEAIRLVSDLEDPFSSAGVSEIKRACQGRGINALRGWIADMRFRDMCANVVGDKATYRLMRAFGDETSRFLLEGLRSEEDGHRGSANLLRGGLEWAMDTEFKSPDVMGLLISDGLVWMDVCRLDCYGRSEFSGDPDRICDWALLLAAKKVGGVSEQFGEAQRIAEMRTVSERDGVLSEFRPWWEMNVKRLRWDEDNRGFVLK